MGFVPVLVMPAFHADVSGCIAVGFVVAVVAGTHIAMYSVSLLGAFYILKDWDCTHLGDAGVCILGTGAIGITFVAFLLEFDKLGIEMLDDLMTVVLYKVSTNLLFFVEYS